MNHPVGRDTALHRGFDKSRRNIAAVLCALLGTSAAARAFWVIDLRYSQPTPVPATHIDVSRGERVVLPAELDRFVRSFSGPTLFHVFNPDCPCSRFNLEHVLSIARTFEGRVRFVAILQGEDESRSRESFAARGTGFASFPDPDGAIAESLGVYSTPQAAIVDDSTRLVWRGNYNSTRFCRDEASEYARIALESILAHQPVPDFGAVATTAYGCELPSAEESDS